MALFKIFKGSSGNLQKQKINEGYAYLTPDDGQFYIDVGTTPNAEPVVGFKKTGEVNRIQITAPDILDGGLIE